MDKFDKYKNFKPYHLPQERKDFYANALKALDKIPLIVEDRKQKVKEIKIQQEDESKEYRISWNEESRKIDEQFREDVECELFPSNIIILDQEIKDKIHNLAWERGHSYGYYEVYNSYDEYLDLVQVVLSNS